MCWTELNEHKIIGPNLVKDTEEKVQIIQQRLKASSVINKGLMLILRERIYNMKSETKCF